ncbi:hypothetical protein ACQWU4_03645 [Chryseobacterium sp. MIQD13]|uniref:hypothetical protein n=1 Tax=Chryseobacterium sp. MIQD13 TaxID=3422310 RepID=UPI003D281F86
MKINNKKRILIYSSLSIIIILLFLIIIVFTIYVYPYLKYKDAIIYCITILSTATIIKIIIDTKYHYIHLSSHHLIIKEFFAFKLIRNDCMIENFDIPLVYINEFIYDESKELFVFRIDKAQAISFSSKRINRNKKLKFKTLICQYIEEMKAN